MLVSGSSLELHSVFGSYPQVPTKDLPPKLDLGCIGLFGLKCLPFLGVNSRWVFEGIRGDITIFFNFLPQARPTDGPTWRILAVGTCLGGERSLQTNLLGHFFSALFWYALGSVVVSHAPPQVLCRFLFARE